MTTALQATEAVYEKVRAAWSASAYTLDGENYSPPDASWLRVSVQHLGSGPPSHGPTAGRHVTRRALVHGQCFAPVSAGDGVGAALTLAEAFRDLFEGIDLATVGGGSLVFEAGDVRTIGTTGEWRQVNASIPFTYDSTF